MSAVEGVLDIFDEIGMEKIREKSLTLTAYLMYLIDEKLAKYGFHIGSLREDAKRGGHVALEHEEAYRICQALKQYQVIPDFREPNVIRLAPVALYVSYKEVFDLVRILEEISEKKTYEQFEESRALVV
jgi:kynureninase